jgi:Schlafen, AlbA_2
VNSNAEATARAWVSARDWARFVGTAESAFLDVKSGLYRLDDPGGVAELVKDVAAFANSDGGLLLVGFLTRLDGGREIIEELKPVPASLVDTDRYRKLVRERVQPHIRNLSIEFYVVEDERGVLVIDIPQQQEADKPFVVSGLDGKKAPTAVGVPIRDADATQWLTHSGLQRLLSAGWNASNSPRPDVIKAVHDAVAAAIPAPQEPPPTPVGKGAGRHQQYFTVAYAAGGGKAALGDPTEPVTAIGPGLIQPMKGRNSTSGPVLTVLPDRGGAVVPGDAWDALCEAGNADDPVTSISNVGLPLIAAEGTPLVISGDAHVIELEGGGWNGRLVRSSPGGRWLWRPHTSRDFEMHHNNFPTGELAELYLRLVLDVSWQRWKYLPQSLPKEARVRHRGVLQESGFAQVMSELARRHGAAVPAPIWQLESGSGSNHSFISSHVRAQIPGADGTPAVIANSVLQTGNWRSPSSIIATVDLGVSFRQLQKLVEAADGADVTVSRLSIVELVKILVSAWDAVVPLPGVLEHAFEELPFAAPPFLVFYVNAGTAPHEAGGVHPPRQLNLEDVLDLSVFGDGPHDISRTQTGLRVVGPFEPDGAARHRLLAEGIAETALGWGFLEADVNALLTEVPGHPA